jgi:predicted DNA-binding transcriptional regulator YafY
MLLRFSPLAARYIREKTWHPTQRLDNQPDGGVVLTLRVNHLLEVKRWALSWASDCEVLGPEELRRLVREELSLLLGRYQ